MRIPKTKLGVVLAAFLPFAVIAPAPARADPPQADDSGPPELPDDEELPEPGEAPSLPDDMSLPPMLTPEVPDEEESSALASPEERLSELESKVDDLEKELEQARELKIQGTPITFQGYVDFGAFVPLGNRGVGWVQDFGNRQFPEYRGRYGWVFLGDILATAVNSRGEPADVGEAPGAADRFDAVDSRGAPGFILNEVNLRTSVGLGVRTTLRTSLDFVPRSGEEFALGDFFDVDLAEVEWLASSDGEVSLFAGKTMPVFGIEYKERKANERKGVTPSLVYRYTSGSQLGLKVRAKLLDETLLVAASVTNGSPVIEPFHFNDEIDRNVGKTGNLRLAVKLGLEGLSSSLEGHTFELGASVAAGSQDRALDSDGIFWLVGVDLELRSLDFDLKAQWIRGKSPGRARDRAFALDLHDSGYVELDWSFLPFLGVVLRGDLRDALVTLGTERAYLTKSWRFTGGIFADVNEHVVVKAEYLHNGELGGIEAFDDDVLTSSLLLVY
ncbi:MAG: hypothetical protein HYV07_11080 [Deltaproteobacteria bacterium]|nr:hypothetical protein [Deltaproteobacteria bacterium]